MLWYMYNDLFCCVPSLASLQYTLILPYRQCAPHFSDLHPRTPSPLLHFNHLPIATALLQLVPQPCLGYHQLIPILPIPQYASPQVQIHILSISPTMFPTLPPSARTSLQFCNHFSLCPYLLWCAVSWASPLFTISCDKMFCSFSHMAIALTICPP